MTAPVQSGSTPSPSSEGSGPRLSGRCEPLPPTRGMTPPHRTRWRPTAMASRSGRESGGTARGRELVCGGVTRAEGDPSSDGGFLNPLSPIGTSGAAETSTLNGPIAPFGTRSRSEEAMDWQARFAPTSRRGPFSLESSAPEDRTPEGSLSGLPISGDSPLSRPQLFRDQADPKNMASPKEKIPPSEATSQ